MGVPRRGDQQDRRGLAARRRLDRERRGRPRRQHADRLGRAHRRLGDPPRRGRPRHPVPDDALARAWPRRGRSPRARAGRAPRCSRCRSCTAPSAGRPPTRPRPPRELADGSSPGSCGGWTPERAHHLGRPRAPDAAAVPGLPALLRRRLGPRATARCASAAWASSCPGRSAWPPASTRTPWPSTPSARWASAPSRSGRSRRRRSPATRGRASRACPPTARSSTAWASTTGARRRPPRAWPAGGARARGSMSSSA